MWRCNWLVWSDNKLGKLWFLYEFWVLKDCPCSSRCSKNHPKLYPKNGVVWWGSSMCHHRGRNLTELGSLDTYLTLGVNFGVCLFDSVWGDFWIPVFLSPSGYMLTSFGFFITFKYSLQIPLRWSVIFWKSWTSTGYFSNSTSSSINSGPLSLFIDVWQGFTHVSCTNIDLVLHLR